MKQKRKRLWGFGVCVLVVFLFVTACTSDEVSEDNDDQRTAWADGRFVETEVILPEEMGIILSLIQLEDGTLRGINQLGLLYDSVDGGFTWSLSEFQFDFLSTGEHLLWAAALNQDGSGFFALEKEHLYIDSQGNETWVEIDLNPTLWLGENVPYTMVLMTFTSNNKILGRGGNAEILYLVEPSTGEIIMNIGELGGWPMFMDWIEVDGQIVTFTSDGFESYDLESGGLLEADRTLAEFYRQREFRVDGAHLRLFPAKEESTFYMVTRSGLYKYTMGGEIEQMIDGAFNHMGNIVYRFGEVIALEDNRFLVFYEGFEEGRVTRLMEYTFRTDVDTFPTGEMTVFTLFSDPRINQGVSAFQSQNPHLIIHHEVGIPSGDSPITVSDVINTLNTQMLAGSGPDVLFLDGMNVDAYIENGILLDISEVMAQLKEDEEFFVNILEYSRVDDGWYTVPTYFILPVSQGPPELLQEMTTLSDLANLVETLRQENRQVQSIIGYHTRESLIRLLIHYSYHDLFNEEGVMCEEALTDFLTNTRRIKEANMVTEATFLQCTSFWWDAGALELLERDIILGIPGGIEGNQIVNIGSLMRVWVFDTMVGTKERLSWDYQVHDTFIPMGILGINRRSEHIEESKEFLRFLLSSPTQATALVQLPGIPVNVAGLEARKEVAGGGEGSFNAFCPEEGEVIIYVKNASVEEIERFIGEVRQLERASVVNRIVLGAIIEDGVLYLRGQQSLGEAVEGILGRVNLFLAE